MEIILEYLTIYAPVIFALLSEVGVVMTVIGKVKSYFSKAEIAVSELKESAEYKDLKNQINVVLQENYELKKTMNSLLEQLTHVKVDDGK